MLFAPDVQFRVPAKAVQLGDIVPGVGLGIGQRRDDLDLLRPAARLMNREANHPHLEGLRHRCVLCQIHPVGPLWFGPGHQPVVLAQPPALSQIAAAALVQPRTRKKKR